MAQNFHSPSSGRHLADYGVYPIAVGSRQVVLAGGDDFVLVPRPSHAATGQIMVVSKPDSEGVMMAEHPRNAEADFAKVETTLTDENGDEIGQVDRNYQPLYNSFWLGIENNLLLQSDAAAVVELMFYKWGTRQS